MVGEGKEGAQKALKELKHELLQIGFAETALLRSLDFPLLAMSYYKMFLIGEKLHYIFVSER
jgi:hypothetical protein